MNEIQHAAKTLGRKGGKSGTGDAKRRKVQQLICAIAEHRKAFAETFAARFWNTVKVGKISECWTWQGTKIKTRNGYGQVKILGVPFPAHRIAFHLSFGVIPDGQLVCHKCDNPPCCNPRHLFLGTVKDNYDDMVDKGRNAPRLIGEDAPWSKLTASQVCAIRAAIKTGAATQAYLGKLYGVARTTIAMIAQGRNWKHL